MNRPDYKVNLIKKICRSYCFYKILGNVAESPTAKEKEYFDELFKDVFSDMWIKKENREKVKNIELSLGDKFNENIATLEELEILSGLQSLAIDHLDFSHDMKMSILDNIMMVEICIREEFSQKPKKWFQSYVYKQTENLFNLEENMIKAVAESLSKQGMEGTMMFFGNSGGLKRLDF